jgi:hypothetical protein
LQHTSDGSTAIYKLLTTPKREQRSSKEKRGLRYITRLADNKINHLRIRSPT